MALQSRITPLLHVHVEERPLILTLIQENDLREPSSLPKSEHMSKNPQKTRALNGKERMLSHEPSHILIAAFTPFTFETEAAFPLYGCMQLCMYVYVPYGRAFCNLGLPTNLFFFISATQSYISAHRKKCFQPNSFRSSAAIRLIIPCFNNCFVK
jgi:hypothetical protein